MDGGGDGGAGRCMEGRRGVESDINRILLRYRPIAPKPVAGGSGTGSGGGGSSVLSGKRTKRKYVRVSTGRCKNKDKEEDEKRIVTLQLLPERADLKAGSAQSSDSNKLDLRALEMNDNNNNNNNNNDNNRGCLSDEAGSSGGRSSLVESWVVVETVENVLYTDDSRPMLNDNSVRQRLEGDSCPGFIATAESGRVEWVNEAYRKMVGCGSDNTGREVVVWLAMKEEVAEVILRVRTGFSCWVKVQYSNLEDRGRKVSMVLPCDAWRVERGRFAWRLDARAALCLGIITDTDGCFRPS